MAIHRGIQSVLFYYISCAPYNDARSRRKMRKDAERDREQKRLYEELNPGLYRHPSPFATNPNWQTEIDRGPGRVADINKKKRDRAETNNSALRSRENMGSGLESRDRASPRLGSPTTDAWEDNRAATKHFQREDEELWGIDCIPPTKGNARHIEDSAAGITRPPTARTTNTRAAVSSRSDRRWENPGLNDRHPATVTRLESIEDVAWMLQPPPPARVMAGKERARDIRSRADSTGSSGGYSNRRGEEALARQVSARLMDERMRRIEHMDLPDLTRGNSARTVESAQSVIRRHHAPMPLEIGDNSSSDEDERQWTIAQRRRKSRPVHLSEDSIPTVLDHRPRSAGDNKPFRPCHHSHLSTINASRHSSPSVSPSTKTRKRNLTTSAADSVERPIISKQSLLVLPSNAHDISGAMPRTLFASPSFGEDTTKSTTDIVDRSDSKIAGQHVAFSPVRGRHSRRRPSDSSSGRRGSSAIGNENLWSSNAYKDSVVGFAPTLTGDKSDEDMEAWYQWATQTVDRRVSHRWSMDI